MSAQTAQLPAWLTKQYMQQKLRQYYQDNELQVLQLSAKAATGKGDNYVGVMTRLQVELLRNKEREQHSYVMKATCANDTIESGIFREYAVYEREMDMYEHVLPAMSALLHEKLHAAAICVDRQHAIMLLEDLTTLQYRTASRVECLDLAHAKLTLEMLAKYHAAAAVLKQRQPALLEKNFGHNFFTRGCVGFIPVFDGMHKALLRYVQTQPRLKAQYYEKLQRLGDNLMEYSARAYDVTAADFQTLSHGDCWTSNIMFRYDEHAQPVAVLPLDFQFSHWTSPITDLHYLFNTSLREELLPRHTELVQHYYYALEAALQQLQFQGSLPSLRDFQLQYAQRRFLAVYAALLLQPIMTYDGKEEPKYQNIYQDTAEGIRFQDSVYASARVHRIVELLLPIFDAEGLLDEMS